MKLVVVSATRRGLHGVSKKGPRHRRHRRHFLPKLSPSPSLFIKTLIVTVTFYQNSHRHRHFLPKFSLSPSHFTKTLIVTFYQHPSTSPSLLKAILIVSITFYQDTQHHHILYKCIISGVGLEVLH